MDTIARYHIESELGKGAMGVVYRATDPNIGRVVALKTMRLDVHGIEAEEMLQRAKNEARSAGVLNHPNIVTIYDAGEADGLFYMAMEVIEGETLQQLLAKHRVLPVEQILSICRQVGDGLDYAHGKGVIHRDIKPANIMVTTSGLVKVMDFGIAKLGGGLTSTGQVLGTPNYMSPEQIKGRPLDGRTDLFSLGVVLYEMLTGEKPFGAQNVTTIIYKIVNEEPISPRELDLSIHPGLSAVVSRALTKVPDQRYQSGAEMAHDLENYKSYGSELDATQSMAAAHAEAQTAKPAIAASVTAKAAPSAPLIPEKKTPRVPLGAPPPSSAYGASPSDKGVTPPIRVKGPQPLQPAPTPAQPVAAKQKPVSRASVKAGAPQGSGKTTSYVIMALLAFVLAAFGVRMLMHRSQPVVENPAPQPAVVAAPTSEVATTNARTDAATNPAPVPDAPATDATAKPKRTRKTATVAAPVTAVAAPSTPAPVANGHISITSTPAGATVKLDGRKLSAVTPLTENDVPPGKHTLQISANGYISAVRSIDVTSGATASAEVSLAAITGTIRVASTPPGADILVDGQATNKKTPSELILPKGDHSFLIRLAGYADAGDLISVPANQVISFAPTLSNKTQGANPFRKMGRVFGNDERGQLSVTTTPGGASVFINGRKVEHETPLKVPVPNGAYRLAIRKAGFAPVQLPIVIEHGKPLSITQTLTVKDN